MVRRYGEYLVRNYLKIIKCIGVLKKRGKIIQLSGSKRKSGELHFFNFNSASGGWQLNGMS
jgi:hypothetical protein